MSYRSHLPQLDGGLFLTDGGIETTLIFHEGLELPEFAAFPLLETDEGMAVLRRYYQPYVQIALERGVGFVLEAPTWRANRDWGDRLGYSAAALDAVRAGVLRPGATAADMASASGLIEEAGFAIYDDVVHGYGGGYWPPVLGRGTRTPGAIPDFRLEANMTLVVQPNVITPDETAGVQLGEMVRITESGFERMHAAPRGFLRID